MKSGRVKINIIIAILYQLTAALSGLILPRFVLESYGSEVNGILQSVNQFLNYATLLECGIGGVVLASLYAPIARGDKEAISDIVLNTRNTFKRLSYVYAVLITILSVVLGFIIDSAYNALFVGSLVLIMGVTVYFNYYIVIAQTILLKADQRLHVVQSIQILVSVLNVVMSVAAMKLNASIQIVKLLTLVIFLINPIWLRCYVKKHYELSKKPYDPNRVYPKKRNGLVHHISFFIHRNTDIAILSVVWGAKLVSVYSIYNSVVLIFENFLTAISAAVIGFVGNLVALEDKEKLSQTFEIYQGINTYITFVFSTVCSITILPFVSIYTNGITDIDYIRPLFAFFLIFGQLMYCLRIPFINVVSAKGAYKETKPGAYMELICNFVISLLLVFKYGLVGVAIGTFAAMTLRTVYTVWYLSKNILLRPIYLFAKDFFANAVASFAIVVLFNQIKPDCQSLLNWALMALFVSVSAAFVLLIVNLLCNRHFKSFIKSMRIISFIRKKLLK